MDRREFLQAGALASAVGAGDPWGRHAASAADDKANPSKPVLPKRVLGKTGVEVTMLNHGTVGQTGSLERLLRLAYREGVRYFDTAEGYRNCRDRLRQVVRGRSRRCARRSSWRPRAASAGRPRCSRKSMSGWRGWKTDYLDLLFFHGLSTGQADWPKSKEMKDAIEAIKKTGKVKFVGFSTHDPAIAEAVQNAAEGGFVDVIMLKFNPWLDKDSPLNKALDACHKANIGLVSMKQIAGQALRITQEKVPSLKEREVDPRPGAAARDLDRRAVLQPRA